ncbi:MAG: alanine racemase [Oscillospiraceae bacterium]|nr:alanine racemase [Oscillospiraceae bacterium]
MKAYIVETALIRKNIETIREKAGSAPVWAVVKGDGYGLGTENMARVCRESGLSRFAVTEPREAAVLRQTASQEEKILMLRPTTDREELEQLLRLGVICTVASQQDAVVLAGVARELGVRAKAHLKIDPGMGRYGFTPDETDKILACRCYLEDMEICGIYTHFPCAFCSKKRTKKQAELLKKVADAVVTAGFDPGEVHCCNSAALMRLPELAMGGVRVGSALLGRLACRSPLERVGYCQASIGELRTLQKGATCGYGSAWKARKPTQIAVIPVGWYHGYTTEYGHDVFRIRDCLRQIAGGLKGILIRKKLTVEVAGQRCRVLGHVGMLHTVIDVTGKGLKEGDLAMLEINPLRVRGLEVKFV